VADKLCACDDAEEDKRCTCVSDTSVECNCNSEDCQCQYHKKDNSNFRAVVRGTTDPTLIFKNKGI